MMLFIEITRKLVYVEHIWIGNIDTFHVNMIKFIVVTIWEFLPTKLERNQKKTHLKQNVKPVALVPVGNEQNFG